MKLIENIKDLRKKAGLTQAEFSEKIGLKQYDIAKYENGTYKVPAEVIPKMAEAFGVSTDTLYGIIPLESEFKLPKKSSRTGQILEVFEKLSPTDQRAILKQSKGLLK